MSLRKVNSIALAVALFGQLAWAQPVVIDRLEASVNSTIILLSEVAQFRKTVSLRRQLDPIFAGTTVASKGDRASSSEIVEFLIDERLITQAFPVSDAEVEQEINSIQNNNRIDRATLRAALEQQGFTFDDYFELIRASASKRNLIDRDIRTKVSVSDNDVKNYFYSHYIKNTAANRSYHLQVIFISPKNYKTAQAAKDVALRALENIRGGEAFEEVAKRASDDASASSGGEIGTLTEDQMSPLIREQARKLEIGQTSEVFGNPTSGYYILRLVDVKTDDASRYEKAKDEIRNQLAASEYQHQIQLWLDRQRQNAFIHRAGEAATAGLEQTGTP